MPIPVIMPKLEMSQESAVIVEWLKREGEMVHKGEALLTVETDKTTVEIESPGDGILGEVSAQAGDSVPVTTVIATLHQPGEKETSMPMTPTVTPVAAHLTAASGADIANIQGSGPAGRIMKSDVEAAIELKQRASPAARRIARERNINLAEVEGTGPRGRIQGSDLPDGIAQIPDQVFQSSGIPKVIPLSSMRRRIAERMQASYQTTPHINFTMRVDMTELETARIRLNEHFGGLEGQHISVTTLFVKIVASTLRLHPWLNSTLRKDEIVLFPEINIGVAVALEDGLIVPVIQNADQKGIEIIAGELTDLTRKAHQNTLQPGDVANGTFTITNLGPFGIEQFTAIINPGQAAILAVSAMQPEVVPVEGRPEIRTMLRMTLSVDHRIIDGAVASRFMMDLRSTLESPSHLLF